MRLPDKSSIASTLRAISLVAKLVGKIVQSPFSQLFEPKILPSSFYICIILVSLSHNAFHLYKYDMNVINGFTDSQVITYFIVG